jgi:hypothetical protein
LYHRIFFPSVSESFCIFFLSCFIALFFSQCFAFRLRFWFCLPWILQLLHLSICFLFSFLSRFFCESIHCQVLFCCILLVA